MKKNAPSGKKIIHFIPIFIMIVGFSCRQENSTVQQQSGTVKENKEQVEEAKKAVQDKFQIEDINKISFTRISSFRIDLQVPLFNLMDDNAKARVWREKISSILSITKNKEKRDELNKLMELIIPSFYSNTKDGYYDQSLVKWADKNRSLFGSDNINTILLTLNKVILNESSGDYIQVEGDLWDDLPCPPFCKGDCNCNATHYSTSCNTCSTLMCSNTFPTGCGYGGNEECNGKCSGTPN